MGKVRQRRNSRESCANMAVTLRGRRAEVGEPTTAVAAHCDCVSTHRAHPTRSGGQPRKAFGAIQALQNGQRQIAFKHLRSQSKYFSLQKLVVKRFPFTCRLSPFNPKCITCASTSPLTCDAPMTRQLANSAQSRNRRGRGCGGKWWATGEQLAHTCPSPRCMALWDSTFCCLLEPLQGGTRPTERRSSSSRSGQQCPASAGPSRRPWRPPATL